MKEWMQIYQSPIGPLTIAANEQAITRIFFGITEGVLQENSINRQAVRQLEEYFAGERKEFDLKLEPAGTRFQKDTWKSLCTIPYGETRSYRQIAEMINCPKGYRAVGMANNKNPIAIVVPCHRVIGTNGSLTGYAGGLSIKEFLLNMEQKR